MEANDDKHFSRLGISVTLTGKDAQAIDDAIRPDTRIIYIESPTNPLLELKDMTALSFMKQLKLIKAALSLGGVETTICDPATTSHQKVSEEVRRRLGISDNLLRLSVGIENVDDLIADISDGLGKG